jgi:hypothetical protein
MHSLELCAPDLAERVRQGTRVAPFKGADFPFYFRKPHGPGWALVGDAGLLLVPVTGQGISHAFRDAELLADAVADGLGGIRPLGMALGQYHRARDKAARPMYDFTARLAAINPPTPAEMALFRALSQRQEDSDAFFGALTGSVPLREFMSPRNMVRLVGVHGITKLMLGQAVRGKPAGELPESAAPGSPGLRWLPWWASRRPHLADRARQGNGSGSHPQVRRGSRRDSRHRGPASATGRSRSIEPKS